MECVCVWCCVLMCGVVFCFCGVVLCCCVVFLLCCAVLCCIWPRCVALWCVVVNCVVLCCVGLDATYLNDPLYGRTVLWSYLDMRLVLIASCSDIPSCRIPLETARKG